MNAKGGQAFDRVDFPIAQMSRHRVERAALFIKELRRCFLRWAGVAIVDMAAGFREGLSEAPRIFFAPLVGVGTEIRKALADLDAKHARQTSSRGWDLIGYPGVRLAVGPDQQRTGAILRPIHRSAYDYEMFSKVKRTAGTKSGGGTRHGH